MSAKKKKAVRRKPAKKIKKKVIRKSAKKATKKVAKKRAVKKPAKKVSGAKKQPANTIGSVTHYFPHVRAAVIKLKAPLVVGDVIKVTGHTTNFTQTITSMQIDHVPITAAKKGDEIGLLVNSRVRQHDAVIKV
jgi:hypothetical protein